MNKHLLTSVSGSFLGAVIVLHVLGCASAPRQPQIIQYEQVKPGLDRHMETEGFTLAQAVASDYGIYPDLLRAGQRVLGACKVRVNLYLEKHYRVRMTDRQASQYCRPYLAWTTETWLKEQEVIMGAVTKDPDRLPPKARQPWPFYQERKSYKSVKSDVDRMLAALEEGLRR